MRRRTSDAELEVRMPKGGSVSMKVAYSPWLHAEGGCLRRQGEFTAHLASPPLLTAGMAHRQWPRARQ
ncbi:hypothetical protein [Streptomyces sp. NPDC001401]|uniref:hypothetical protein n=1 Tax=Streptomyces sp. NPDC001401 TaxID=3364570 RepID=UPI00367DE202